MKSKHLLFASGVLLGLCVIFLLGAAAQERIELLGELTINSGNIGLYRSTISGADSTGKCYLAITNTVSGRTEVYAITETVREKVKDIPSGKQGSFIFEPQTK